MAAGEHQLQTDGLSAQGILKRFGVKVVCTTDDPAEPLNWHEQIRTSGLETRVYPTFRPDRSLDVHAPEIFNPWADRLAAAANVDTARFDGFLDALRQRHQAFHDIGGRLSDHGLPYAYADPCTDADAVAAFDRARAGHANSTAQARAFASWMMLFFARLDAEKGWTKQLHLGALRNVNTRACQQRAGTPATTRSATGPRPSRSAPTSIA